MPKKREKIRNYQKYDQQALADALHAVRENNVSQRRASQIFGIPQATISDHIRGKIFDGSLPGRKPIIPKEVEQDIAAKAANAAEMGLGVSRVQLMQNVGRVVKQLKIKTPFKQNIPGKDWWKGFTKRNTNVTLRTPEKLTSVRARGLNQLSVGNYFVDLHKVMSDNGLLNKPESIWNMDEKGVSLEHRPIKVVASKSSRNTPGRVGNSRTSNTIISCISATGVSIPPLIIVKGKTEKSLRGYNMKEGPVGSKWTYQKNAWTEDVLGLEWFCGVFLPNCGKNRPQLLVVDGHHSHETLGLIEAARKENIILMCLPPHTTHFLCPLDRTVFGPLSRQYNKLCSDYVSSNPANNVDKLSWPCLLNQAYSKSMTTDNIISGFRSCGIFPFNPTAVPFAAFAPSSSYSSEKENESHPLHWVSDKIETLKSGSVETLVQPGLPNSTISSCEDTLLPCLNQNQEELNESVLNESDNTISTDPLISGSSNHDNQLDSEVNILHEISLNMSNFEGVVDLPLTIDTDSDLIVTNTDWDFAVNSIFQTASPPPFKKAKKNTSHRLLTADEMYERIRKDEIEKQRKAAEKEARKEIRKKKKLAKNTIP